MRSIEATGFCRINILQNDSEEWVLGTDFMNGKEIYFQATSGQGKFTIEAKEPDY